MKTFLLYGDAIRNPEMRHEIAEPIADPITFIEHDGTRIVVGGSLEAPVLSHTEDLVDEFWVDAELGRDELVSDPSFPELLIGPEIVLRALKKLGTSTAIIPATFPIGAADYLRDKGVELVVDQAAWGARRRRKAPWELEGIERAQRAADTAMLTAARMLKEAEPEGERLRFEGEVLTSELMREAMTAELSSQGAESEEIMIQSSDACLDGHDIGTGPILRNRSCVIDCFPRDRRSGAYSDMTRTFVAGTPSEDLKNLHKHCLTAFDIALDAIKPGASDLYAKVAEYFHAHGFPTQLHHSGPHPLDQGFTHSLGHGVGLEVHEKPWLGRRSDELLEGDVIAVEPGLYVAGIGGVRLEDTLIVTATGPERFTDPFPYDLEP